MSVPVALEQLREEIGRYGPAAFFLTVGNEGRPHSVHLPVAWVDPGLLAVQPGRGTRDNARKRPLVSLLWPPPAPGDYSLIVDAEVVDAAEPDGSGAATVTVRPTRAVLHRAAAPAGPGATAHGSDCVRVFSDQP